MVESNNALTAAGKTEEHL